MMKARINITIDFNIFNTRGLSDEILKRVIHSKVWEEIERLHKNGNLDVGPYIKSNQYLIETPEAIQ